MNDSYQNTSHFFINPINMMRFILLKKSTFDCKPVHLVLVVGLTAVFFSSCVTYKNAYYFKTLPNDTTINSSVSRLAESTIKKADQLAITISSLNPDEDRVYNAAALSVAATAGLSGGNGYTVDANGHIQLHRLGNIHAEGMTRRELKNKIETDIKPYLKDPVVTVKYLNHRVTVIGEIAKPSIIPMPEERISLLEALGSSGDVSALARKDNILIIRETETGKQFKRLNLEDHSIFTSEWYYLQPDDVVYVEPNDDKIKQAKRAEKQQVISLVISGVSLAVIILNSLLK